MIKKKESKFIIDVNEHFYTPSFKENYSKNVAGAVSLFVKDTSSAAPSKYNYRIWVDK